MIDHQALCRLIPHQGTMCLLDAVLDWDAERIRCRAISHRDPANPLRNAQCLPGVAGLEYAAQGMAVHGALVTGDGPARAGYLAALRDVQLTQRPLDSFDTPLEILAERLMADARSSIYALKLQSGGEFILSARATVIQEPAP
ncbi:MAG TPA: hypothetical protein VLN90_01915 [Thioalkalivibrio sp.]|nr:hypothetical protein [Thioalkalivibrio sp.]